MDQTAPPLVDTADEILKKHETLSEFLDNNGINPVEAILSFAKMMRRDMALLGDGDGMVVGGKEYIEKVLGRGMPVA